MLKIDRVILDNFCQHSHCELQFPAGITGVFGRNGAGKSNIANAIYSAFTGTFNRHAEGAAGCIKQGHDSAYIEVHGELGENTFRLRRDIFPSRLKHTLWIDGQKYSERAKDIETWITEASGLTPQLMSEFVFIRQQDLYAFLDANDTERSKKFATLCNTRIYERLRDEYGEMLKIDHAKSEAASDVSIDLLKQNIVSLQGNIKDLQRIAKEIENDIKSQPETREVLQKDIDQQKQITNLLTQYGDALSHRNRCLGELDRQRKRVAEQRRNTDEARITLEKKTQALADTLGNGLSYDVYVAGLKAQQKSERERDNLCQRIQQTTKDIIALPDLEEPLENTCPDLDRKLQAVQKEITELCRQIESQKKLIDTLDRLGNTDNADSVDTRTDDGVDRCPLCGSESENWTVSLNYLREDCSRNCDLQAERNKVFLSIKKEYDQAQTQKQDYEVNRSTRQWLEDQVAMLERSLAQFPKQQMSLKEIDRALDYVARLASGERLSQNNVRNAEQSLSREEEVWRQVKSELDRAEDQLRQLASKQLVPESDFNRLYEPEYYKHFQLRVQTKIADDQQIIDRIDALLREQAENNGSIREAERQLEEAERKLQEQEDRMKDSGKTRQWFDSCDKAITWFKKDGLPRLIHRSVLRQLSSMINAELEQYDKPFVIEVNDDLTFTALFADGRRINSRVLSGGQKAMLALSLLSAINRTFLQDIGIMIWDEPTEGLDPINTESLYGVLERKKKLLHQRGQQLVIITFDEGMIPVFDAVYQVDDSQKTPQEEQ